MQQSSATPNVHICRDWVAEDCCMLSLLLAVPSCIYSFWHGVIPTSYLIFIHTQWGVVLRAHEIIIIPRGRDRQNSDLRASSRSIHQLDGYPLIVRRYRYTVPVQTGPTCSARVYCV